MDKLLVEELRQPLSSSRGSWHGDAHQLWGATQVLLRRGTPVLRAVPPDVTGRVHLHEETGNQPHTSPGRLGSPNSPLSPLPKEGPAGPGPREGAGVRGLEGTPSGLLVPSPHQPPGRGYLVSEEVPQQQ